MKLKNIIKKEQGHYITRYDLLYETVDHKDKVYEMISRDQNITSGEALTGHPADAVVLILHNKEGDQLLLNKEFRMACGDFVFNFPAGLIEPDETYEECARRELKEETGLDLVEIRQILPESFSAVGFSNEKNVCIIGVAEGNFAPSHSTVEELEAGWYTKEEVRELLQKEYFAARTQAYCYLWGGSAPY